MKKSAGGGSVADAAAEESLRDERSRLRVENEAGISIG